MSTTGSPMVSDYGPEDAFTVFKIPTYAKLLAPLPKLNPMNRRLIRDWLIGLFAASGAHFQKIAFAPPVPRDAFRIKFNLTGEGYWTQLSGIEEIEFFDQLYKRYIAQYTWYQSSLCSFIVSNVDWVKDPTLARLIRGTEAQPGWGETGEGLLIYNWLKAHGSTADAASQELLRTEWAGLFSQSLLTKQGRPRDQIIFEKTEYAEDIIERCTELLDLYERVEAQRNAPAIEFVKVLVSLLHEDVKPLFTWGSRLLIDLQTGDKTITATRADFVGTEADKLIRAVLPSRQIAFHRVNPAHERGDGALNIQRGGPMNGQRGTNGPRGYPPSGRPPFQPAKGGPAFAFTKEKKKPIMGQCRC